MTSQAECVSLLFMKSNQGKLGPGERGLPNAPMVPLAWVGFGALGYLFLGSGDLGANSDDTMRGLILGVGVASILGFNLALLRKPRKRAVYRYAKRRNARAWSIPKARPKS